MDDILRGLLCLAIFVLSLLQVVGSSYDPFLYEVFLDNEAFEAVFRYSESDHLSKPDAYHAVRVQNDALATICNRSTRTNEGKKILLIQDSFCWYSTTYLAGGVSEIDAIYPGAFTGSIRAYVEACDPDVVILMICERNIDPIDWTTHTSIFDLR